jgi:uncharacterized protein YndB with AHSA1/START domain
MNEKNAESLAPIHLEVTVPRSPDEAFRLFTEGIASWWPADTHSLEHGKAEIHFDGRPGGDIYEQLDDGRRHLWGTVIVWEPPFRVSFTWHPGREASEAQQVEMRFDALAEGTRVTLEHRGWENAGIEGPILRAGYAQGWLYVFGERYAKAAGAAAQEAS